MRMLRLFGTTGGRTFGTYHDDWAYDEKRVIMSMCGEKI